MERYRRAKGKQKLLGSHQKCWIWGRNLVRETLAAGRWPIVELHLAVDLPADQADAARSDAARLGVPVVSGAGDALTRLCHSGEHQGFLARMAEYPYAEPRSLLESGGNRSFFVVCDRIQDPFNFGAILRSAEIFGAAGVFIGESGQVRVTSMVARSSAGAVNRLAIAEVPSLTELSAEMRGRRIRVIGASEKAECALPEADLSGAVAVVVGNEGQGISPDMQAACDLKLRIPQAGRIGSLNAAVAAGIFFYEVSRQRR